LLCALPFPSFLAATFSHTVQRGRAIIIACLFSRRIRHFQRIVFIWGALPVDRDGMHHSKHGTAKSKVQEIFRFPG
jgi:hypothetical protein